MEHSYTYNDLQKMLKSGDFSVVKGKLENAILDVKERLYDLGSEKEQRELCKDVSAFANGRGGFIIVGIAETPAPNSPHKIIDHVVGVDKAKINLQTITQHLENHVYPKVRFDIRYGILDGKDVLYIEIPQDLGDRPYLVKLSRDNLDYLAYYSRTGEHGTATHIEQIHETLRRGQHYESHLVSMDGKLDVLIRADRPVYEKDI